MIIKSKFKFVIKLKGYIICIFVGSFARSQIVTCLMHICLQL